MKIAVFSDSHGDVDTMCSVVEKEKPDAIIHLGDGLTDAKRLKETYPDIQMITTIGNVDSKEEEEWIKLIELCGKRIVMTHGHTFITEFDQNQQTDKNRIESRNGMIACMRENNADLLLHGHTHEPYLNHAWLTPEKKGWIMNPGTIRRRAGSNFKPTYGVLTIRNSGALEWQLIEVE